jgi:Flp pilus assembly protein TadG
VDDATGGSDQRGAGLVGTIAGATIFFVFLLFAVQLLIGLYATSAATSAAFDGARLVAGRRIDADDPDAVQRARADAEVRMRSELGRFGQKVRIDWTGSDGDTVVVRVQGRAPRFLFPGFDGGLPFDRVDRIARVRVERPR